VTDRKQETSARYGRHHAERREGGELIFVPERIPLFQRYVGGPGRRVLDLGCRSGAVTRAYAAGNEVTGVDVDRRALERAAAALSIETVWADVDESLPFENESFDVVVAAELLEHVRDPAALMGEIRRVLRPGGTFVGSVPNGYRLKSRLLFLAGRPPEDDPTHLHLYSPAMLLQLLEGFSSPQLHFVGGRFRRLHPRLLARDVVFAATRSL